MAIRSLFYILALWIWGLSTKSLKIGALRCSRCNGAAHRLRHRIHPRLCVEKLFSVYGRDINGEIERRLWQITADIPDIEADNETIHLTVKDFDPEDQPEKAEKHGCR